MKPAQFYESEFGLLPGDFKPRHAYAGLLDSRWIMIQYDLHPLLILDYYKGSPEDRKWIVALVRNVVPGFMNKGMRRAIMNAFNRALEKIYREGGVPILPISLDTARRISGFTTG